MATGTNSIQTHLLKPVQDGLVVSKDDELGQSLLGRDELLDHPLGRRLDLRDRQTVCKNCEQVYLDTRWRQLVFVETVQLARGVSVPVL